MFFLNLLFVFVAVGCLQSITAASIKSYGYDPPVERKCVPGQAFINDCNTCTCSEDGLSLACTMMECPPKNVYDDENICVPGDMTKIGCKLCTCGEDGIFECPIGPCGTDEDYLIKNLLLDQLDYIDANDVRKKRQANDYGVVEDQDYLDDEPAPLSKAQREELERQRYVQLRQGVMDKRREQRELTQQRAELARQQDEMKQELDYQRDQDYQQWQEDQNQLAMDAQQQELDQQQDYYDQQQLVNPQYFKRSHTSRKS